jgi:hypothetical protein
MAFILKKKEREKERETVACGLHGNSKIFTPCTQRYFLMNRKYLVTILTAVILLTMSRSVIIVVSGERRFVLLNYVYRLRKLFLFIVLFSTLHVSTSAGHHQVFHTYITLPGARGSVVVKALCCKPEGRGFKSR